MAHNKDHTSDRRRIRLRSLNNLIQLILLFIAVIALFVLYISRARLNRPAQEPAEAQETAAEMQEQIISEEQSDLPDIDLSSWNIRLVRYEYPLGTDFAPELTLIEDEQYFDSRAAGYLTSLILHARNEGYSVYVCSLFRNYDTQYEIYWNHIYNYMSQGMTQEEAEAATRLAVSYPGTSEHQLGLAADLLESREQDMEPYIGGSGLMLWLEEHCAEYGFIIRYPDGKTEITGVEYEPWHLRYVGQPAAEYIMEHGLTLEEFLALYE